MMITSQSGVDVTEIVSEKYRVFLNVGRKNYSFFLNESRENIVVFTSISLANVPFWSYAFTMKLQYVDIFIALESYAELMISYTISFNPFVMLQIQDVVKMIIFTVIE